MSVGRNDPCPCGSGRKHKHCCLELEKTAPPKGKSFFQDFENGLPPHVVAAAKAEPTWEVDVTPLPLSVEEDAGARPGVLAVMAGEFAVHFELLSRPPAEGPDLALELQRGMEEVRRVLGRYPHEVLVRHISVGRELIPFLSRHGIGLRVTPFLDFLDDMTAELLADGGRPLVRSIAACPETWRGWGLPETAVVDLFQAAADFYREEPWTRIPESRLTEVRVPGGRFWSLVVTGGPEMPPGCLLFEEPGDAAMAYSASSVEEIWEEIEGRHYSLLLRKPDDLPRAMRKEIASKGWPVAGPSAFPILTSTNTPGGGISIGDAGDLCLTLQAMTNLVKEKGGELSQSGELPWTDPVTGAELVMREFAEEVEAWEEDGYPEDDLLDDDFLDDEFLDDMFQDEAFLGDNYPGGSFLADFLDDDLPPFGPGSFLDSVMDPEARAEFQALLSREDPPTLEELNRAAEGIADRFNQRPMDKLGGLSPAQVERLLRQDWSEPGGPLVLNRSLPLEELSSSSRLLRNTRIFLGLLDREDGAKLTSSGNLNRAFVRRMIDEGEWPEDHVETLLEYRKVVNEGDFFPLHSLRVLTELAGLIRKFRGSFVTTKQGRALLAEERAGELFAQLFETQFKEMNLAFLDRYPMGHGVQLGVPYSLFHLREAARNWHTPEELAEPLLLPAVREGIPNLRGLGHAHFALQTRFLEVLERFGLVEQQEIPGPEPWMKEYRYRTTPLYERFLTFEW